MARDRDWTTPRNSSTEWFPQTGTDRFDPTTREDGHWELPVYISCFALAENGALVALATGLYHLDLGTGRLTPLAHSPFDARRFIFNDGRCDPVGRFFAGTMYLPLYLGDQSEVEHGTPLWR